MEFNDLNSFITIVAPMVGQETTPITNSLLSLFYGINQGCSCTRQARIARMNSLYNEFPTKLSDAEKNFLKEKLSAPIIAKNGESELWRIE